MDSKLQVCENCEFGCEQAESAFLKCLIDSKERGLFEYCEKFKAKSGEHVTI